MSSTPVSSLYKIGARGARLASQPVGRGACKFPVANRRRYQILCLGAQRALAAWIAAQTRDGVAGISRWRMPSGARASHTAFMVAASEPTVPASPTPLTPNGLTLVG